MTSDSGSAPTLAFTTGSGSGDSRIAGIGGIRIEGEWLAANAGRGVAGCVSSERALATTPSVGGVSCAETGVLESRTEAATGMVIGDFFGTGDRAFADFLIFEELPTASRTTSTGRGVETTGTGSGVGVTGGDFAFATDFLRAATIAGLGVETGTTGGTTGSAAATAGTADFFGVVLATDAGVWVGETGEADVPRRGFAAGVAITGGGVGGEFFGACEGEAGEDATEGGEVGLGGFFTCAKSETGRVRRAMGFARMNRRLVATHRTAMPNGVTLAGKKLGVLLSGSPDLPPFLHGVRFAAAALAAGCDVYLYCIDDAVPGVGHPELQQLRPLGLKLYGCAYGAHRRGVPLDDRATFGGLTVVSDLVAGTDRFISFQ